MIRKTVILLTFIAIIMISSLALASAEDIAIFVDGTRVHFADQQPYIDTNGRTMVPIRFPAEHLQAAVNWEGSKQEVTVEHQQKQRIVKFWINKKDYTINTEAKKMDTVAVLTSGRTLIPIRFVGEALDADVRWEFIEEVSTNVIHNFTQNQSEEEKQEIMSQVKQEVIKDAQKPSAEVKGLTKEFTQADYNRVNSYPYVKLDHFTEPGVRYREEREWTEFVFSMLMTEVIPRHVKNQGWFQFIDFKTDTKLLYTNEFGDDAIRGIFQIKCTGQNDLGLTPGKTYEVDIDFSFLYTSKKNESGFVWTLARRPLYLGEFKEVK